MTGEDRITIVDENDKVTGAEGRKTARQQGLRHRMVKIVLINSRGDVLIQQRSASKEESPLKWDLSATGHVDAGEDYLEAARRETQEEIGIENVALNWVGKYYYERVKDGLVLRRFNGVFTGHTDASPVISPAEVAQIRWIAPRELQDWLKSSPTDFTTSFKEIFDQFGDLILNSGNR